MESGSDNAVLKFAAYAERVDWAGASAPTLETLASLQLAHLSTIPFENLDVQMGIPIRLDLASLQDKFLRSAIECRRSYRNLCLWKRPLRTRI